MKKRWQQQLWRGHPSAMQNLLLLLLLPLMAVLLVLGRRLLRLAPPTKGMQARLAAFRWALVRDFSTVLRKDVFVTDRATAHRLLVRGCAGGAFCNRPPTSVASVMSRKRHQNIGSVPYGPLWRAMRRHLVSEVFQPSRLSLYAPARRCALRGLLADLHEQCTSSNGGLALAAESLRAATFSLAASMCFGNRVDAGRVRAMADVTEDQLQSLVGLRVFAAFPALAELVYRKKWSHLVAIRRKQGEMYIPLINARRGRPPGEAPAYVDTLIDLHVAEDNGSASKRGLTDGELVALCSEFLGAGTTPVTSTLQWIMANLIKSPGAQEAVRREIDNVVGEDAEEVMEEDLGRLEYLHAVLMETLRLHPAVPLVTRQVTPEDDVVLDGRRVTAGTTVQFPLERLARDKAAWADPDAFRPERFLAGGEGYGLSLIAAGEIRMMPFGVGRRMCPGMTAALLHVGYFVANLVREFEWTEAEGDLAVDLQAQVRFLNAMKRPLRARLVPRRKTK